MTVTDTHIALATGLRAHPHREIITPDTRDNIARTLAATEFRASVGPDCWGSVALLYGVLASERAI